MNINKVILAGNLTRDVEQKAMPSGVPVANFGLATNHTFKDKDGSKKENPSFHEIVVFGNQSNACAQYLKKGDMVFVEGRINYRSWDKPDGSKGYKTEIIAERVQFGPKRASTGQNEPQESIEDAYNKF